MSQTAPVAAGHGGHAPADTPFGVTNGKYAIWMFLMQDCMGFVGFFAAYALVRDRKPRRIVEVGSGHSTRLLSKALGGLGEILAIDPAPRADIADLPGVRVVPSTLQAAPPEILDGLQPGDALFAALQSPQHFLAQAKNILGIRKHQLAGLGQHQTAAFAGEQGCTQTVFQLPDLRRKRRLRGVEVLRCPRQVTQFGHAPEVHQVVEIELFQLHCSFLIIKLF